MQLILRDVDFALVSLLRKRASKNGRTPEQEHRAILEQALRGEAPGSGAKYMSMLTAAQNFGAELTGNAPAPAPKGGKDSDG